MNLVFVKIVQITGTKNKKRVLTNVAVAQPSQKIEKLKQSLKND
jgi:hypothetical protein